MATPDWNTDFLTSLYIPYDGIEKIAPAQIHHRINLIRDAFAIPVGSKVLEIGCGQGDCTTVLAHAVGSSGHVDALDPCSLTYGAPYTVGDSWKHISKGTYRDRITFINEEAIAYLNGNGKDKNYDFVVIVHPLWYFRDSRMIRTLLSGLLSQGSRLGKICIAEWSLKADNMAQVPHLLAALTRQVLERRNPDSSANIQTAVSPYWLESTLAKLEAKTLKSGFVDAPADMQDGKWEIGPIVGRGFEDTVRGVVTDEDEIVEILCMRDAVRASLEKVPGGRAGAACMPVFYIVVESGKVVA